MERTARDARIRLDQCRINTIGSVNANSVGDLLNYSPSCCPGELPVLSPCHSIFNNRAAARSNIELYTERRSRRAVCHFFLRDKYERHLFIAGFIRCWIFILCLTSRLANDQDVKRSFKICQTNTYINEICIE